MRLRTALKILNTTGTPDQARYRKGQINAANARMARTRTARAVMKNLLDHWWDDLNAAERVRFLVEAQRSGLAFDLLMREGGAS